VAENAQPAPETNSSGKVQVFVSFDVEHDGDLYERLVSESESGMSSFEIAGASKRSKSTDKGCERARRRIRAADQVIVICGEHTGSSVPMNAELLIAQEEETPYLLLWGRREVMCTKPVGAKPNEGMYRWTHQTLQHQITLASRKSEAESAAVHLRRPPQPRR